MEQHRFTEITTARERERETPVTSDILYRLARDLYYYLVRVVSRGTVSYGTTLMACWRCTTLWCTVEWLRSTFHLGHTCICTQGRRLTLWLLWAQICVQQKLSVYLKSYLFIPRIMCCCLFWDLQMNYSFSYRSSSSKNMYSKSIVYVLSIYVMQSFLWFVEFSSLEYPNALWGSDYDALEP